MIRSLLFILLIVLVSCKTVMVKDYPQQITTQNLNLAQIGTDKTYIAIEGYQHTARPQVNVPIKVSALPIKFKKRTYKAYQVASQYQPKDFILSFVDSLPEKQKPDFLHLQIADQVSLVEQMNTETNEDIQNYLKAQPEARIITELSVALPPNLQKAILDAESVYLVSINQKDYALNLYQDQAISQQIKLSEGVVFTYRTSGFCWQENTKHQLEIVSLTRESSCPPKTYLKASRAKEKVNYFKL